MFSFSCVTYVMLCNSGNGSMRLCAYGLFVCSGPVLGIPTKYIECW